LRNENGMVVKLRMNGRLTTVVADRPLMALAFLVTFMVLRMLPDAGADGLKPQQNLILKPERDFAASSHVHRLLPERAELLPESATYVREIEKQVRQHGVTVNIDRYAPPVFIVPANGSTMTVRAARAYEPAWSFPPLQRQWNDVPIPQGFRASEGTDKEAVIYQPETGRYWEFWGLEPVEPSAEAGAKTQWRAAWGGRIDRLSQNPGYFPPTLQGYKFGVTATSLPLLAGLMTIAEQRLGEINHVIHVALPETRRGAWVYPAQRTDGTRDDPLAIPQGTLFRLPADLDLGRFGMHPYALMIARAVQRHGMVVRDTAGVVAFYAENPLAKADAAHPYFGLNGILQCPSGEAQPACYPDGENRLKGFPWHQLQAVRMPPP
jgi:hypothetical protein